MHSQQQPIAAIVDYGLGNLFSIRRACAHEGLSAIVTSDKKEILAADAVILPGVGAFGDAMSTLHRLDLVSVLRDVADSKTPLFGVCLGIQLLMSESLEFGVHKGLGIIEGTVAPLESGPHNGKLLKVPQVQWNRIYPPGDIGDTPDPWAGTLLAGMPNGEYMYFVHSFVVRPIEPAFVLATTRYGPLEFCSVLRRRNIFACQFHPERSGPSGLRLYRKLAEEVSRGSSRGENHCG